MYGYFKIEINEISNKKIWTWLRKGNLMRETESLLIEAKSIKTNYVKAKIDITQQNSGCKLCANKDEIIRQLISECSKLAQKEFKTRHDWVDKVIQWELCKNFKFDYENNAQPRIRPEERDTQTSQGNTNRSPNFGQPTRHRDSQQKKRQPTDRIVDLAIQADSRVILKESEKRDKYHDLARELKKYGTWTWRWYLLL